MDRKDLELNKKIMFEVGLDQGSHRRLVDQDYGVEYKSPDGRYYVAPDSQSGVHSVEFNPACNSRQAEGVFQYFSTKLSELDEIPAITTYYSQETDPEKGLGYIEVVTETNERIRSGEYANESLRYADIIMKINGSKHVDLSEYDKSKEELDEMRKEMRYIEKMQSKTGFSGRLRDKKKSYDPTKEKDVL